MSTTLGLLQPVDLRHVWEDKARDFTPWLARENTVEDLSFFGLEIELWRIGESPPVPKFNVISKPNDWTREVKTRSATAGQPSETKKLQYEFWTKFKECAESNSDLRVQKPGYQYWLTSTIGRAYFHVAAIISSWSSVPQKNEPEIRVELSLTSAEAKKQFAQLKELEGAFAPKIALPLIWHSSPDTKSKVYVATTANFMDKVAHAV